MGVAGGHMQPSKFLCNDIMIPSHLFLGDANSNRIYLRFYTNGVPQQLCALRLLVTNLDPSTALVHAADAILAVLSREEAIETKEESSGERMTTYCTCNAYSGPQAVSAKTSMLSLWGGFLRLNQQLGPSYPTHIHDQHLPHAKME